MLLKKLVQVNDISFFEVGPVRKDQQVTEKQTLIAKSHVIRKRNHIGAIAGKPSVARIIVVSLVRFTKR